MNTNGNETNETNLYSFFLDQKAKEKFSSASL